MHFVKYKCFQDSVIPQILPMGYKLNWQQALQAPLVEQPALHPDL